VKSRQKTGTKYVPIEGKEGIMSRKMDALIAEHVMGWQFYRDITGTYTTNPNTGNLETVPHYSTDIAAAMEVVEKIRAEGFVNIEAGYSAFDVTMKDFSKGVDDIKVVWGIQPKLPMAICLAALKLRGVEHDLI
jgi:hypothetical protein